MIVGRNDSSITYVNLLNVNQLITCLLIKPTIKFYTKLDKMKSIKCCIFFMFVLSIHLLAQTATDSVKIKGLKEVKIIKRNNGNEIDELNPMRTEKLTQTELKKNACCNLAESFETSPTVDVSYSNALTGSRQIQMLGLSGTYVQMMTDLLPTVRGLNYTYGFSNIPGSQVNSIFVNKGPGSVTNGFESMTGQIDIELQKPEKSPRFFLNAYLNSRLRSEINSNMAHTFSTKWSTMLMVHGSTIQNEVDMNNDGYLDRPLYKQFNFINRWKYEGQKVESMFGIKGLYDDKIGGETTDVKFVTNLFDPYKIFITTKRWEIFDKTSFRLDECGNKSIGIQTNFTNHSVQAVYGHHPYTGEQQSLFANVIYQTPLINENHQLRLGGGLLYDKIDEKYKNISLQRSEPVTGLFTEYLYKGSEIWSALIGMRGDYNFNIQKFYFIPRANVKYSFTKKISVRASAGSGFRTANVFAENTQLFANNRTILITEKLNPEYSWNYGLNFTYDFKNKTEDRFSIDLFKTDFKNQVIADFDADPKSVTIANLKGKSYAWYLQAELYYALIKNLDIRLAYKYSDVQVTQHGILMEKAFNAKHRALFNVAYQTRNKHWKFDYTIQGVGPQRLPDLSSNPEQYRLESYSPSYCKMLGQITYVMRKVDVYVGSENINNFTQKKVIIDPQHPYGEYFDAGNIWGPVLGRMFYTGFRYTIK